MTKTLSEMLVTVVPKQEALMQYGLPDKTMIEEVPLHEQGVVMTLGDAVATRWQTAALFQHVPAPDAKPGAHLPRRGASWAFNLWDEVDGLPVEFVPLDMDFGETPKRLWKDKLGCQAAQDFVVKMLEVAELLKAGWYFSATGARLFVVPGQQVTSATYSSYVKALIKHVKDETGVGLDEACSDFGHLFRLPFHISDNGTPKKGQKGYNPFFGQTIAAPETIFDIPSVMLDAETCPWIADPMELKKAAARKRRKTDGLTRRVTLSGDVPKIEDIKPDWRKVRAMDTYDEKFPDHTPNPAIGVDSWSELKEMLKEGVVGVPGDRNNRMMLVARAVSWVTTNALTATELWHIIAGCVVRSETHRAKQESLLEELWFFCHGAALLREQDDEDRAKREEQEAAQIGTLVSKKVEEPAYEFEVDGDEIDLDSWASPFDDEDEDVPFVTPAMREKKANALKDATRRKLRSAQHILVKFGAQRTYWGGDSVGYVEKFSGRLDADVWRDIETLNPGVVDLQVITTGSKGQEKVRWKTTDELMREYASTAGRLRYSSLTATGHFSNRTLTLPCWKKNEALGPIRHEVIENWLRALCGEDDYVFQNLQRWLSRAVDTRKRLCGLYIVGAAGAGKSLFGEGLSALWGSKAVPYAKALERFQADGVIKTPVMFADEGVMGTDFMSDTQKGEAYRNAVSYFTHPFEMKGIDTVELDGYRRVVICANNENALRFGPDLKHNDVMAIAERVSYIIVDDESAAKARDIIHSFTNSINPDDHTVGDELMRDTLFPEYVLWCHENVSQSNTRFGGWESGQTKRLVERMGSTEPMLATIAASLLKNPTLDSAKSSDQPVFFHTKHDKWYIRSVELEQQWDSLFHPAKNPSRKPRTDRLVESLKHITVDGSKVIKSRGHALRVFELNTEVLVRYMMSQHYAGDMPCDDIWRALGGPDIQVED